MYSRRFDRLFSEADSTGQFVTRPEVARALIDWADGDDQMFRAEGASGAEDYRYDARADRYRAHDNSYDTIEEIKLVRGVSESFMEAFVPYLTVYASDTDCKVQRRRHHQQEWRRLHAAAHGAGARGRDLRSVEAAQRSVDPGRHPPVSDGQHGCATARPAPASTASDDRQPDAATRRPRCCPMIPATRSSRPCAASRSTGRAGAASPRSHRRASTAIVATGESGRVKQKITAIVDTQRVLENPLTLNPASEKAAGVLQYWREE